MKSPNVQKMSISKSARGIHLGRSSAGNTRFLKRRARRLQRHGGRLWTRIYGRLL